MSDNPWLVEDLKAFWYLNCPECEFKTQKEEFFQGHAVENHPLCFVLFETLRKTPENCDHKENLPNETEITLEGLVNIFLIFL